MSHFNAYFKFKIPQSHNIMGLSEEKYDVLNCEYQFDKRVNRIGEVNSDIEGGIIKLLIIGIPSDVLLGWVFDHTKRFNGEVTIIDPKNGTTLEQVYFEEARCHDFRMDYDPELNKEVVMSLKISSHNIRVGNVYFELAN